MQVARDAAAFRRHRRPFHLRPQPRVFDGERGLVAHHVRQFQCFRRETARFDVIEDQAAIGFVLDGQRDREHGLIIGVDGVERRFGFDVADAAGRNIDLVGVGLDGRLRRHVGGARVRARIHQPIARLDGEMPGLVLGTTDGAGVGVEQTASLRRDVIEDFLQREVGVKHRHNVAQPVRHLAAAFDLARPFFHAPLQRLLGLFVPRQVHHRPHHQQFIADRIIG